MRYQLVDLDSHNVSVWLSEKKRSTPKHWCVASFLSRLHVHLFDLAEKFHECYSVPGGKQVKSHLSSHSRETRFAGLLLVPRVYSNTHFCHTGQKLEFSLTSKTSLEAYHWQLTHHMYTCANYQLTNCCVEKHLLHPRAYRGLCLDASLLLRNEKILEHPTGCKHSREKIKDRLQANWIKIKPPKAPPHLKKKCSCGWLDHLSREDRRTGMMRLTLKVWLHGS